ncbi:hypothetical protein [Desulfosporosinus sp. FKA]|uniref:hypothetical protein n=1 Tax=Desulfosporosinus sp. FKA TaxID=1969834 RepID=UPI000B49C109|nr:hypothetical protein [Desulfosporosinus sp. FKA]
MNKIFLYKYPDGNLYGVVKPLESNALASIKDLMDDIKRQTKELKNGTHLDGYLIPWGHNAETLVVQEGSFNWSNRGFYYEVKQPVL